MRTYLALAGAAALAALGSVASAEDAVSTVPAASAAVAPRVGQLIVSSEGRRLGRVDRVDGARVGVIINTKYVYIPTATLSAGENGRLVTSLTNKQVLAN